MKLPELELGPGSLFVGDLHLDPADPEAGRPFVRFLEGARGAPVVAILGDLFEFWTGPAQLGEAGEVLDSLCALAGSGTEVLVVPGNRDFLLDARFERRSGTRLCPGGFVGRTPSGERVLAVHGDELCTLDRGYQRLRRVLRSAPVRALAPRLPAPLARAAARRLRRASTRAVARKPGPEVELQASAGLALARACGATVLVCGHAHAFRDERLAEGVRWLVVDAFGGARDTLVVGPGGGLAPLPRPDGAEPARRA